MGHFESFPNTFLQQFSHVFACRHGWKAKISAEIGEKKSSGGRKIGLVSSSSVVWSPGASPEDLKAAQAAMG